MSKFTDAELGFLQAGERRLARIATIGPDGTPHVTPVGYAYDPEIDGIEVRVVLAARSLKVLVAAGDAGDRRRPAETAGT